ncbi:MAG TPA: hypothetical protein VJ779_21710 [Acetobacteraceae bacterium]|nr:hypothetical protein [Acetobacteraceae bacterium]
MSAQSSVRPVERGVTVKLVLYWLIAGLPLAWGVANTIGDAAKLFR